MQRRLMRTRLAAVCLRLATIAAVSWPLQAALASDAEDIRDLVQKNQASDGYALGLAHPDELGDPEFDLYFGMAAVGAGHPGEGVLALERYVQQFPDDLTARTQLAAAYFALGDDLRARQEFEYLQKQNPPPEITVVIDHFLVAIKEREAGYRTTTAAYVEAGLGFDNNTNSGAGSSAVSVPVLGAVTLQPGAVKIPSVYQSIGAGASISTPVSPGITIFGAASLDDKINDADRAGAYDIFSYGVRGGATYTTPENVYRLTASVSGLDLDGTDYLNVGSLTGDVSHPLDQFQSVSASLGVAGLRYPTQPIRNSTISTLDVTYHRVLALPWDPVVSAGFLYGYEDNSRADNLARNIYGLHVDASLVPLPQWVVLAGINYQESDYVGNEPLLNTTRQDDFGSLDLLAIYQYNKNISVRFEALISGNHSNLGLYAYDRNVVSAKIHYDF